MLYGIAVAAVIGGLVFGIGEGVHKTKQAVHAISQKLHHKKKPEKKAHHPNRRILA